MHRRQLGFVPRALLWALFLFLLSVCPFTGQAATGSAKGSTAQENAVKEKATKAESSAAKEDSKGSAKESTKARDTEGTAAKSGNASSLSEGGSLSEDGSYTTKEDVSLYLYTYGKLPGNFITKKEARKLGWSGGDLTPYAPGKCIGGDRFGNYEGQLPEKKGRKYWECDIGTLNKKKRGAKRLIYSDDGLIYYTEDHYETFTLLYNEKGPVKKKAS